MEAYIPGLDFHSMNGIFNRSVGDYHCKDVVFFLHDMIGLGHSLALTALQRYNVLKYWDILGNVRVHPILAVSDNKDIWLKYFNDVKETGGEGVVLKQASGLYYPDKRNSSLMKIKLEDRFHLLCTDMFYTVGDKGHSNLNITLRRKSGTEIVVRVGKHDDIDKIENDKEYVLGKVCLIECMTEITPGGMLREPRFKNVVENFNFEDLD
jgi:ATP-dependent DNA ligase